MIKIFLYAHLKPLECSRLLILLEVDLLRTVTLPHLEPFGISDGLELKVSDYVHVCSSLCSYVSEDQETRLTSAGWRRDSVSLPRH